MAEPVVSVVFRTYNCEKYVGQAIESILNQTFQDFEIVVVDDGSTDETPALLQALARRDQRIRVFSNEPNQGPVKTMNRSVRQARGEFIAVHDADDVSLPHRLETQVSFLRAHPEVALVGGGAYFIDEEGQQLRIGTAARMVGREVRDFLEAGQSFIHSSVMYRRKCIEAIGFYDEFFAYSHDYDMLLRMANIFDLIYDEKPLVKWRKLNSGITGRKKKFQAAFAELARRRIQANRQGLVLALEQEYQRLIAGDDNEGATNLQQSVSDADYYYRIGIQLLEQGNKKTARRRFLQVLKCKGNFTLFLRTLIFYILSFWPNGVNIKPVQVLRKIL